MGLVHAKGRTPLPHIGCSQNGKDIALVVGGPFGGTQSLNQLGSALALSLVAFIPVVHAPVVRSSPVVRISIFVVGSRMTEIIVASVFEVGAHFVARAAVFPTDECTDVSVVVESSRIGRRTVEEAIMDDVLGRGAMSDESSGIAVAGGDVGGDTAVLYGIGTNRTTHKSRCVTSSADITLNGEVVESGVFDMLEKGGISLVRRDADGDGVPVSVEVALVRGAFAAHHRRDADIASKDSVNIGAFGFFHQVEEGVPIIGMIDDETSLAVVLVAAVRHGEITVDKLQPTLTLHTDKCTAVFHGCGDFRRSEEAVLQGGLVPTPAHQTSVA